MPRWRSFVRFPLLLLTLLTGAVLGSCEPDQTLTQADPGISPVPERAEAASAASSPPSEGGEYVAICETTYRPVWFRGERRSGSVRLAVPMRAVDAAHGHDALFRYRRYDLGGELSHTADCVIPYSGEAIRIAVVRFSLRSALPDSLRAGGAMESDLAGDPALGGPVVLGDHCGTSEDPCELEEISNLCADHPNDPECQEQQDDPGGEDDPPPPDDEPPCDPTWDDSCGGGGSDPDPGDGDPEVCDPAEETCNVCGDERDVMIQEYDTYPVTAQPTCLSFTQSASSLYFQYSELTVNNPHAWAIVSPPLTVHPSSGYGLDRWRELYGAPRILNSGYRCPHYNNTIPGASDDSRHMHGDAADMRNESRTWSEANAMQQAADEAGADFFYIAISSIDGNLGWVHADWRYR